MGLLDRHPFRLEDPEGRELLAALLAVYDQAATVRQFVATVGMSLAEFAWNSPMADVWPEILRKAANQPGRLRRLIEVVDQHPESSAYAVIRRLVLEVPDSADQEHVPGPPSAGVDGLLAPLPPEMPNLDGYGENARPGRTTSPDRVDIFISYGKEDEAWALRFAEALRARGVNVFLDVWSIQPGEVSMVRRGQGIEDAANGVLVFSRASVARPEVMDDYAALLDRAHQAGRRFIPILIDDVQLPIFARIRRPIDFANDQDGTYEQHIDRLVRTIRLPPPAE